MCVCTCIGAFSSMIQIGLKVVSNRFEHSHLHQVGVGAFNLS